VILSAGLTPAWQQILVFDSFHDGEVNRARDVVWCSSGKVFNAGIGVHHLGGPSLTLAPVGGPNVPQIAAEFGSLGIPYRWIETRAATRICTTLLDRATGTITELVENGRPLTADELDAYLAAYAEQAATADVVVLIGSLPQGTPETFYRQLLQRTPCPAVLDFRGAGLLSVLDLKPYVVKPNRDELAQTAGRPLDDDLSLVAAMQTIDRVGRRDPHGGRALRDDHPLRAVVVQRLHPPAILDAVNPIASGDAMSAAIAWATRAGHGLLDAVRLSLAAAAQNVRQLLPCRLNPHTLEAQAAQVRVERLG